MGIDAYGFSVLPAGFDNGGSLGMGTDASFWTSTVYNTNGMFHIQFFNSNDMGFPSDGVFRILAGKKIASVGKITEKKLLEYGIRCDFVPEDHTGEGLGKLLASLIPQSTEGATSYPIPRILLLQGNLADDTLLKLLPQATRWVVYETLPVAELPEWKCEAVASADAVVFASTSAVENFIKMTNARPHTSFCIGRMTESAARKYGFETVTSDETTMDSLVKKIVEYYTTSPNH